jgi:hypothetical protein
VLQEDIKVQAVATQALGYVGSFLLCYTSCFVVKGIESFGGDSSAEAALYPLLMMTSIVLPLQGFFNMAVYCRPSYLKIRSRFPMEPRRWAIRHTLLATDLSPFQQHGVVIASSMETGSQTSVCTGMDSSSFHNWNSSGRHSSIRPRSVTTSVLCSVAEIGEDSEGSDGSMRSNSAQPQLHASDILKERQSYELCSYFEAECQGRSSIIEEEIVFHSDGDSSIRSSSRCDDDSIDSTQLCHLEAESKEEDLAASRIPFQSTSVREFQ